MDTTWSVYMVRCADNTLYTGVTTDVAKRVAAHNTSETGAKYTKTRRPVVLVYTETGFTRGAALSREAVVRKLPRQTKLLLLKN